MSEAITERPAMTDADHKLHFFRQSGWMMISAVGGGVLMSLVHVYSKFIPAAEYEGMAAMIQLLNWITIPAIGLQSTFAQQTSAAATDEQRRQLYGTVWAVTRAVFFIWLAMAVATWLFQGRFTEALHLSNPALLWVTLLTGLIMLSLPVWQGLLQGRHNFLWLGWAQVFNAVGRLSIAGVIVYLVSPTATSVMVGAFAGMAVALGIALWQNLDIWKEPADRFRSGEWLARVVPLSLGLGISQFLFSADALVVQHFFPGDSAPYMFGGTLARAIVLFTAPLVAVMFPKIVHSAARQKKSNLMGLTLLVTVVLASMAAIGVPIISPYLIKYGSKPEYVSIVHLMPLFCWSMVPLAVGNVLLNNLMAHSRFKCVPFLLLVGAGYVCALWKFHSSFAVILQVLGVFNLLFLLVCIFFTWGVRDRKAIATPSLEP